MNREIKFRAWDGDTMFHFSLDNMEDESRWIKARHWEIMQYTGLKDTRGKEIYEGDIINGFAKEVGDGTLTKFTYEVFWDDEWKGWGGRLGNTRNNPIWGVAPWTGLEVIGNIYENPELLS